MYSAVNRRAFADLGVRDGGRRHHPQRRQHAAPNCWPQAGRVLRMTETKAHSVEPLRPSLLLAACVAVSILSLLCPQYVLSNTSIVGVRLNDQVVVAADSKRVRGDLKTPMQEHVCKIGRGDGFFFATAGLSHDSDSGFNPASVIAGASSTGMTLEQKVERLQELITKPLTQVLDQYRQKHPVAYEARFKAASALQAIFFGLESGSTVVLARDFVPTSSSLVPVQISVFRYKCPGDCKDGEQIFKLGRYDVIDRFLSERPDYWKFNPAKALRTLIEMEIADAPGEVGPPIDIVRLDKHGVEWIERKDQCR